MKFIRRMVIKWRLLMAKRQLAYMYERRRHYLHRMSVLELTWLNHDIRRQVDICIGMSIQLANIEHDDNETEALSINGVSPMFWNK